MMCGVSRTRVGLGLRRRFWVAVALTLAFPLVGCDDVSLYATVSDLEGREVRGFLSQPDESRVVLRSSLPSGTQLDRFAELVVRGVVGKRWVDGGFVESVAFMKVWMVAESGSLLIYNPLGISKQVDGKQVRKRYGSMGAGAEAIVRLLGDVVKPSAGYKYHYPAIAAAVRSPAMFETDVGWGMIEAALANPAAEGTAMPPWCWGSCAYVGVLRARWVDEVASRR